MKTILLMLAALPLLAAGASDPGRLSGRVYDVQGTKHVANAIVTVTTPKGFITSVTTDKDGQFSFNQLPEGSYDFRVTAKGFAIYERQVSVAPEIGLRTLDIRLRVPANRQTISVLELRKSDNAVSGF